MKQHPPPRTSFSLPRDLQEKDHGTTRTARFDIKPTRGNTTNYPPGIPSLCQRRRSLPPAANKGTRRQRRRRANTTKNGSLPRTLYPKIQAVIFLLVSYSAAFWYSSSTRSTYHRTAVVYFISFRDVRGSGGWMYVHKHDAMVMISS